jgi:CheY-like chemotaxis protein
VVKHILIVDDEKEFLFSAEIALRNAGYRTEAAIDGKKALVKIREAQDRSDPFDLLVLDIRMPGMSGVELIDELNRREIVLPALVMSAYIEKPLTRELEKKGCFDIIEKPFPPKELVGRIAEVLSKLASRNDCYETVAE